MFEKRDTGIIEIRDTNLTVHSSLVSIGIIITSISVLFLLSSVVIFIISGIQFFSHEINVLHFNHTLILFVAIISLAFIGSIPSQSLDWCLAKNFFLQFLWTNVFISSLSVAILVFYSIWIVSIQHTARKLYKYLIPIGWCVSLLWAVVWLVYDIFQRGTKLKCTLLFYAYLEIGWEILGPITGILLINTIVLLLSLIKIWIALKRQSSQEGEFKKLRKIAIGGILLIPTLGLLFISMVAIKILRDNQILNEELAILIIILINSPIGIVHFILITCQIKQSVLRKCCCYCKNVVAKKLVVSMLNPSILMLLEILDLNSKLTKTSFKDLFPLMMSLLHTPMKVQNQQTN